MLKRGVKVLVIIVFFLFLISFVNAAGLGVCLSAHVTDISPTSINIGEEFTVGIEIDNCGYESPDYVTFELKDISPYIQVTDSLKKDIGKIGYASSNRFILYHMKVRDDAIPGTYSIPYELVYGPNWNNTVKEEGKIEIKLVGDEAKLNIASLKTKPTLPIEGDTVELTLRIENYGKGSADSVRILTNHKFKGTKESFIGTLDPEEDGPAVFTFIVSKKGEYEIPVKILFSDDFGNHFIDTSVTIVVLKRDVNIVNIILGIIIVIGVGYIIFNLLQKAKKKDEVIKQLLSNKPVKNKK